MLISYSVSDNRDNQTNSARLKGNPAGKSAITQRATKVGLSTSNAEVLMMAQQGRNKHTLEISLCLQLQTA